MEAIIAMDVLNGIAKNNVLPWNSNTDMKFFYHKTIKNIVLMGNITFLSIPEKHRPLKNRLSIVFTREPNKYVNNDYVIYTNDLNITNDILSNREKYNEKYSYLSKNYKLICIGGKQIYEQFIPFCNTFWITKFKQNYECDLYFDWKLFKYYFNSDNGVIIDEDEELIITKYTTI
jgi:dihydrofolate reductase